MSAEFIRITIIRSDDKKELPQLLRLDQIESFGENEVFLFSGAAIPIKESLNVIYQRLNNKGLIV